MFKNTNTNTNIKLAQYLVTYIESCDTYKNLFTHHKQQYSVQKLFEALLYKLETGISYNNINNVNLGVKGGALFYFYQKIIKNNVLTNFYDYYVNEYINQNHEEINTFYVDSTLIANKLGIDKTSYNVQLKKHRSTKISLVEDNFGIPLDIIVTNSNVHDASICIDHITNISNKFQKLCSNKNKFIADAAYDSKNIREHLKNKNLGILICDKNKRNTKDKDKIDKLKMTLTERLLLKKRSSIEHLNNNLKQNRTINVRYEKNSKSYESFVTLSVIKKIFKIIKRL